MKTLEAVIFDCDGIIVDSDALQVIAEQHTAPIFAEDNKLDFDPETDWSPMQGWARRKIAASIFGIDAGSEIADNYRQAVVDTTVEIAVEHDLRLVPGITDFRNYLAMHGLIQGVATNSNRAIYTKYCELNPMDFAHPDFIVTQGECVDDKPLPGQWLEVMDRMGVEPARTLIVEDSGSGITSGRFAQGLVLAIATTKSMEFLHARTDAQLVAADFNHAAHLLQPYLPR